MDARSATPPDDERIARLADRQQGPIARWQLDELLHLGHGAIDHRVRCGRLREVAVGVYVPGHRQLRREGTWMTAVLAAGRTAALSHGDAAAAWDLRRLPGGPVHVTVPGDAGRRPRSDGVVVHRARGLLERDVERLGPLRVTSVAWTARDLAASLPTQQLVRLLERAELLRLFDRVAFADVVARGAGRRGTARLRAALAAFSGEAVMTRSELEDMVLGRLATTPIEAPQVNVHVLGEEADFVWPRRRLVLEVDGWATHRTRAAFERDRRKDARRRVAGWATVRASYLQVRDAWPEVAAALLAPTQ